MIADFCQLADRHPFLAFVALVCTYSVLYAIFHRDVTVKLPPEEM